MIKAFVWKEIVMGKTKIIEKGELYLFYRAGLSIETAGKTGKAQKELGILREASYVISAKNPDVETSGFPDEKPDYPKKMKDLLAEERWIDVSDPELLDYENAQFLHLYSRFMTFCCFSELGQRRTERG